MDQISSSNRLTPLEQESGWLPVNPSYTTALRVEFLIIGVILTTGLWAIQILVGGPAKTVFLILGILIPTLFLLLIGLVIPRKVKRIRYLVRELDVNLRHGLLWYISTSVANNRIQHIEVSQGPLERSFSLGALSVFTAGGLKSDLKIPGLDIRIAQQLKAQLLQKVGEEELADDEL